MGAFATIFGAGFLGTWLKERRQVKEATFQRYMAEIERLDKKIDSQSEQIKDLQEANDELLEQNYSYRRKNAELKLENIAYQNKVDQPEKRVQKLEKELEEEQGGK